jgi:hypothetical protein
MPKNKQDVLEIAKNFFNRLTDEEIEVRFGDKQKEAKIKKIDLDNFSVKIADGAPFIISKDNITREGKSDFANRNFEELFSVLQVGNSILEVPVSEFRKELQLEEERQAQQQAYEDKQAQLRKSREEARIKKEIDGAIREGLGAAATALEMTQAVLSDEEDFVKVDLEDLRGDEDDFVNVSRPPSPSPAPSAANQAQPPKAKAANLGNVD